MSAYFPSPEELARHTISPGVELRTCACEKMTLSQASLRAGAVVAEHSHPHEQVGMVLEGRVVFFIGKEEKTLGPGDLFRIPGGVPHKVTVLDQPARVLDIFHPVREEYR
jgi:quercetin dioxygenase-like cupin family protein